MASSVIGERLDRKRMKVGEEGRSEELRPAQFRVADVSEAKRVSEVIDLVRCLLVDEKGK